MTARLYRTLTIFLLALGTVCGRQVPQEAKTQEPPSLTFQSQTRLVLLSFRVSESRHYLTGLKPPDVVLLEDGKPRDFTIFDSPTTQGRMPLEMVLLFDTNPKIDYLWDPEAVFRFVPQWTEEMSRTVLEKDASDFRISVYRCSGRQLYRLSPPTKDPRQLSRTFGHLLAPELAGSGPGGAMIPLSLPSSRKRVGAGAFTEDYVTSSFISAESRGWPLEAAAGALNDAAAAPDKVPRILVMFSEGIGATTTVPEDVGNHALDMGIPIYPIVTNYQGHIDQRFPRNLFRMGQFAALGKMTGGGAVEVRDIDAAALGKILGTVRADGLAQYVVGFAPSSANGTPRAHKLEIRLAAKSGRKLDGGKRRAVY